MTRRSADGLPVVKGTGQGTRYQNVATVRQVKVAPCFRASVQCHATCSSGGHVMSNSGQSGWNLVKAGSGWYLELSG